MSVKTVDLQGTNLEELLELLQPDTEILLTRNNIPLARLIPVESAPQSSQRVAGLHQGTTWVSDDFDDPLPDQFWSGEE